MFSDNSGVNNKISRKKHIFRQQPTFILPMNQRRNHKEN